MILYEHIRLLYSAPYKLTLRVQSTCSCHHTLLHVGGWISIHQPLWLVYLYSIWVNHSSEVTNRRLGNTTVFTYVDWPCGSIQLYLQGPSWSHAKNLSMAKPCMRKARVLPLLWWLPLEHLANPQNRGRQISSIHTWKSISGDQDGTKRLVFHSKDILRFAIHADDRRLEK